LGYLATSGAKSDVTFLLGTPNFLQRQQNFAPISLSFRALTWDRQTDDRCDDHYRRHLHLVCEPKKQLYKYNGYTIFYRPDALPAAQPTASKLG